MVRPRHEPIVISNEKNIEWMKENLGRRKILQLIGAGGAASLAGCGGGGGGQDTTATETSTETETATETTAETETATESPGGGADMTETPTPTATPGETVQTPTGEVEVSDVTVQNTTFANFENLHANEWNAESGFLPAWQSMRLAFIPSTASPPSPTFEGALRVSMQMLIKNQTLDPKNNEWTLTLRDNINWGSGQEFTAQHVLNHAEIIRTQVELGETSESTLPISMEAVDDKTVRSILVPGNAILRYFEALFQGNLNSPGETHPVHHKPYLESLRSATTNAARQKALQKLFSAKIPAKHIPDFALGPFIATDWSPAEMNFKSRTDFPWGFDLNQALPGFDIDQIYAGAKEVSIGAEQTELNVAVGGERDYVRVPNRQSFQRLEQANSAWELFSAVEASSAALYFSPRSKWGEKTEKARKVRQAVAFGFDAKETAAINNLTPAYEVSTGFVTENFFNSWIGKEFFMDNYTNYGFRGMGYAFPEKMNERMRAAGFSKNNNGFWVDDATGEVASMNMLTTIGEIERFWGMTRPVMDNVVEQLNEMGFKSKGMIKQGDAFENQIQNFKGWDVAFTNSQTEVNPHPYFGFREDMGLGSAEGLPAGISSWDWRNGYRRVKVPMPVGNPDGTLTTMDWDKLVKKMVQIQSTEKMKSRVRTLTWINNQWVPGVFVLGLNIWSALNTDVIAPQPSVEEYPAWLNDEMREPHTWNYASGRFQPP